MANHIKTDLTHLLTLLSHNEEMRMMDAAQAMRMDEHTLEKVAKMLAEKGIIEIRYSLGGHKILRRGERIRNIRSTPEKTPEPVTSAFQEASENADADRAYRLIKKRRYEKGILIPKAVARHLEIIAPTDVTLADVEPVPEPSEAYALDDYGRLLTSFRQMRQDLERLRAEMESAPAA